MIPRAVADVAVNEIDGARLGRPDWTMERSARKLPAFEPHPTHAPDAGAAATTARRAAATVLIVAPARIDKPLYVIADHAAEPNEQAILECVEIPSGSDAWVCIGQPEQPAYEANTQA